MSLRVFLFFTALSVSGLGAACSSSTTIPRGSPGTTPPGEACAIPEDCGCWQCACQGVGGQPGSAQLCVSGVCPTGEVACAPSCAAARATVAGVTSADTCIGVP